MPGPAQPSPAFPASVLVVEDERIVALDLQLTLESLGFRVVGTAATQAEAVLLTMSYRPDLILMDINLGSGGDGIRAAEEIARFADVPVVFLTAYADNDILKRAGAVAPFGYLVKPVQPRELNATVQMALANVQATRQRAGVEKRLRLALDAARMGVVTLSDDVDFVQIDGHFPPVAHDPVLELRMPLDEFLDRLPEISQAKIRDLLHREEDLHILTRWRADRSAEPSGWMEIHATYLAGEGALVGICRDVTRQVEQETALRQAAVVFESAADAILILNADGRVHTANPAFKHLTGWSNDDIRGRHPNEFLHARRTSDRSLLQETPDDFTGHAEVICLRQDGSSFPAWEHVAPVRDNQGRVTQRVLTFTDISALRQAEGRIRHLAYHDGLTGMGNRNRLRDCLQALEAPEQGEPGRATLLFIDLDGFKVINDSLGHEVGDALLITIAERIRSITREQDQAFRLGGDEFVLLLERYDEQEVARLSGRLLEVIRSPMEVGGSTVQVSASIGIARFPDDGDTPDALLRAADVAMYAAKAAGRNGIVTYRAEMATVANERLAIEQGLLQALTNGELSVHWQPQVSLVDGSFLGAEALVRWHSERLGPVGPDRFITVAEESGLIQLIGRWVMNHTLATWSAWRRQGKVQGRLALNVSALQLLDERFPSELQQALESAGLDAQALEIEVTESALQRVPNIEQRLSLLANLGVRIALDDFGTGYSSLSMLKLLPLHRLKVDRAFIRDVVSNPSDQAIVRAIVAMSDALGLELIAEGVETAEQQQWLLSERVAEAQGWFFARAMPDAEFLQWLRD